MPSPDVVNAGFSFVSRLGCVLVSCVFKGPFLRRFFRKVDLFLRGFVSGLAVDVGGLAVAAAGRRRGGAGAASIGEGQVRGLRLAVRAASRFSRMR